MAQSPVPRASLRVLIIEDHVLFAESMELALSVEGYDVRRLSVPDHGRSVGAVVADAVRLRPRVVLLDLDLGNFGDGARLIRPLAVAGANVIVVTASMDRARWGETVAAGARKVLPKSRPLNEILAAVRRINQGLPIMSREEREELLNHWQRQRGERHDMKQRLEQLTNREGQVLGQLMRGRTVRDISGLAVVSEATVRTQVKSILAKLQVSSQLAAVGLAHNVGWQPPHA